MSERVIPPIDQRLVSVAARVPSVATAPSGLLGDSLGRPLRDLRISVTDRCNFRCSYCMPKEIFDKDYAYLPHSSLLSFEEITRVARQFVAHGVQKIRLTGGEPLLRKNLEILIGQLAALRTVEGQPLDITLTTNGWRMDEVLPSAEVVQRIHHELPLVQLGASAPGETAERWGYADGSGEIGVISSVTQAFCGDCNRARLSTEGQLYLCLFASQGHDLRHLIRGDATDEQLASAIAAIWQGRSDRYSQLRASLPPDAGQGQRRVEMSYIGG